jgi:hypothetical protein
VDTARLKSDLDNIFDQALIFHGFTSYMRDYEMFAYCTADPRTGIAPEHLRYLFKLCVVAETETAIPEEIWSRSLDERLIDYDQGKDLGGYVWGTQWQVLYPGAKIIEESTRASHWTSALERDFHEVRVETNGHNLTLIFSELEVTQVEPGYSPFTVPTGGPDFKYPFH